MKKPIENEEAEIIEEVEPETPQDPEDNPEGGDGEESSSQDDQEVEIVLDGDDGSQPAVQNNLGIRKRINKLNTKVNAAQGEATQATADLENERQKNKLLQMALDQRGEATVSGPPDPLDYDDGARDDKYATALTDYTNGLVRAEMQRQAPEPQTNRDLEVKQTQHYEAADKLGVKDYDDVEGQAVTILGKDTVNRLIGATQNSPRILYYLGKNPDKAQAIADLVKTDPIKGVMELGVLDARLKVSTKAKRNQAPNPDDELEGALSPRKTTRGPKGATYS